MTRPVRPLAARHWLLRNPRRILPAIVVQALVTALVLTVVTPLSGFEATAETALRPLRSFTAVTPMRKSTFDAELTALLEGDPGLERHVPAKTIWMRTPAIVGEFYTMIIALDRAEQERFYAAVGNRVGEGRYPTAGTEEVVIHRDVARARKMSVGSTFGRLVDPEDPAPGAFKVVGIADGESRVGLADLAYAMRPDFVLSRIEAFEVVFAKEGRKAESDRYLNDAKDAEGRTAFKVWDEAFFRRRTERSLANLPVILNAVVGAITVVIALVVILLNLISFQARADEFALLLAVGRTRRRLVGKLLVESCVVALVAWGLGLALGFGCLHLYDRAFLEPKAIEIRFFDPYPIALASLLPLVSAAASAIVLALRLSRMDPVSVIQRRNA